MNISIAQEKLNILNLFLKNAAFDGWNEKTLSKSTIGCGYSEGYHLVLFPNGLDEFTQYFHEYLNSQMTEQFLSNNTYFKISDKIIHLVELKLSLYATYKESIRALISYNVSPLNICTSQKRLWQTCDQMWHLAGDEATDYNYYTKRAILAKIYSSTLLYWLADDTENFQATREYLRKQIKSIGKFGQWKSSVTRFFKELLS